MRLVKNALIKNNIVDDDYEDLIDPVKQLYISLDEYEQKKSLVSDVKVNPEAEKEITKKSEALNTLLESRIKHSDLSLLLKEFDTTKCSIKEDWDEWLNKTSFLLLKESPSPILYACSTVAEVYQPIASTLYNISFILCWGILKDHEKEKIMTNVINAINNGGQNAPLSIL